jgi:3-oxoacyl-[acyl-carrier-protein] synthase II
VNAVEGGGDHIVITGAGLVTSLGLTRAAVWEAVAAGRVGMGPLTALEQPLPPGKDGGQAVDLPADFAPELPREVRYLRWTIAQALREAGIPQNSAYAPERSCFLLGTTLHGMRAAGKYLRGGTFADLKTFLGGDTLRLAKEGLPFKGLAATNCSACSSSLGSIALAVTLLQNGDVDLIVAGGYDTISEYVYGGFNSLRLVAEGPLRPFARGRQGMKLAEGYGIVVLERATDAAQRGAKPIAAILGWGESADAHHLTQPHPQGDGAARAMEQAIARAGVASREIGLISAHATGTPDNDAAEYAALSRVFREHLAKVPVVGFKSHLGHTLGAAGAVELILAATAMKAGVVPPCASVRAQDVEFADLNLATDAARRSPIRATLNTSLGFGGANTCVILGSEGGQPVTQNTTRSTTDVFITGIGVILPGIVGNDALLARLAKSDTSPAWERDAGPIPEAALEGLVNARRVRRMSDYVKSTLAATTLACRDAGIADVAAFGAGCSAVLGSTHGSSNYSKQYYDQVVLEGIAAANPALFAEAVPNAGAAQLSLMLSLKGACQTIIGTRTAGLDAVLLGAARIRGGVWDRAIVSAGEESCELVNSAYRHCGLHATPSGGAGPFGEETGFTTGAAAITFVLESTQSINRRGNTRLRGRIECAAAASCAGREDAIDSVLRVLRQLGSPRNVMSSACATWIDRAEAAALRRCPELRRVSAIYGHIAESFSAGPLAALAAVLLAKRLPKLIGSTQVENRASGDEPADSVAAICTDLTGAASGVRVAVVG